MIDINDVSVARNGKSLLNGVTFSMECGQVSVLLGRNGSGKSTLLSCVTGRLTYGGSILLDGTELRRMPPRERALRVGLMPQVLPDTGLTVREVAALGRLPHGNGLGRLSERDRQVIDEALDAAHVTNLAARSCRTLSGGERQRVFLALLLAQETECLLLDEPAASLDAASRHDFRALVCDLAHARNKTVLVVTHDLNEALRMADKLIVLDGGSSVFVGTPRQCVDQSIIEEYFGAKRYDCVADGGTVSFFE